MTKTSEGLGSNLMDSDSDSANPDRISGDSHHNAATTALPVVDPNNLSRGEEHKSLPCTEEGYIEWPYQLIRHDNLTISDDVCATNTALNLNSAQTLDSSGKCVIPTDASASRSQMVNRSGTAMSGNIGQSLPNMNLGMTQFNPNQARAEPLLTLGKLDERFMTGDSGSNKEFKSNYSMPKNVTGNSERAFCPSVNSFHNQLGGRSFLNPSFDMTGAFTGFQKDSGTLSHLEHSGGHETLSNSRTGLHLGPSHGFQRPAVGDQRNHHVKQINRHLVLGAAENISMEFGDQFERSMAVPSFPFARPPLVMDTRSSRGQEPSGNSCQSQVAGFIQQSSPRSASGQGNITGQVSRTPTISSRKRGASQPLPYTVQDQRRKILPTQPFNHPSIPTWTRLTSSVPNTPQSIHPSIHTAQSLAPQLASPVPNMPLSIPPLIHAPRSLPPQATQSSDSPVLPTTWTKSALSVPNTSQTIPPLVPPAPSFPPIDNRTSYFHPSSHSQPLPHQQLIAQSLARLRTPLIPPTPHPNPQLIAQALACQRTPLIPPPHLPNQQPIAQPLARQHTQLIPPLPNQQLIAQPHARQRTQPIPPLPNQQPIAQPLARQHTQPIPPLPNQQPIAQPRARQRTQPIPPLPNQQLIAQPLARQHTQLIPPPTNITRNDIKYKDETPEPFGYKCLLCKRDLSYAPEGPISQPTIPPTAAVLSCGHTFHAYCLERITPADQSEDPPCIPCALRE